MSPADVSVVIPTHRRPAALAEAVASARAEGVGEVVVVIDDDDDAQIAAAREAAGDATVVADAIRRGNGGARNAGVAAARHEVIAFLDDDDVWLPGSLQTRLDALEDPTPRGSQRDQPGLRETDPVGRVATYAASPDPTLVVGRVEADTGDATFTWPRRQPRPGESVADYLFRPTSLGAGEGLAQTSTWLGPAWLFRELPFDDTLRRYVDLDWLLRAADRWPSLRLVFAGWPGAVARWDIAPTRGRVSTEHDAADALAFARQRRHLMSDGAYAGFLLTRVSDAAARGGGWMPGLLREAVREGRPTMAAMTEHVLRTAVPRRLLDAVASWRGKR